jgi:hypothetical protein
MSYIGTNWTPAPAFNIRTRRIGGMRWVWIGRLAFCFCIKRAR